MRPRALALSLAGCAAVLAGSVEIGQAIAQPAGQASAAASGASTASQSTPSTPTTTTSASASAAAPATPSASATPKATATTPAGVTGTFAGATEETRYGPMQVEIIVKNGTITDIKALQLTNQDQRSVMISDNAAPILRQEALTKQSAKIDTVSGATYTSDGYISSLQSAIDKAKL
jgi:uncharacterized protein with FMN-binding domain